MVTTPAQVLEEAELLARARAGLGRHAPLVKGELVFGDDRLSSEQREALRFLLKSSSHVTGLRGRAGSGKTTLLAEYGSQLEKEGIRITALSITGDASRGVLRSEAGFPAADTVAKFLASPVLQKRARGHVILIDEAGLLPLADLGKIFDVVGESTRILLVGDTGQLAPVGRGDAMRLLELYAGLPVATVRQIRRQTEEGYRLAVEAMAERDLKAAFARLDDINAILEIPEDGHRYHRLAMDYAQCLVETGIAPLIVSPTHREGRAAVDAVRSHLRELGHLGPDRQHLQYRDLKWEAAERLLPENYERGQAVQFTQNVPGVKRGSVLSVLGVDADRTVWLESPSGKGIRLDLTRAEHFRVFGVGRILLSAGDRVRITNGGKDVNGRRLENGTLSTIKKFTPDGHIECANGVTLPTSFGFIAHGYDTAYSSQGKTAREVFVAQSSASFRASSSEQFYVAVSRGKERVRIYTDSRENLQNAVGNSARRLSALEFTGLGQELFMNGGLDGTEWAKRIAEGKAWRQEEMKTHVEKLMAQRKIDPPQEKIGSYTEYLEMRRANLSADGMSRSKGHPDAAKPKRGQKGMVPDPRGNQKSSADEMLSKVEASRLAPSVAENAIKRQGTSFARIGEAIKASGDRLRDVVGRTKRGAEAMAQAAQRAIQFGNVRSSVGRLMGNQKSREAMAKQQATQKPPAPKLTVTPVIRRGK